MRVILYSPDGEASVHEQVQSVVVYPDEGYSAEVSNGRATTKDMIDIVLPTGQEAVIEQVTRESRTLVINVGGDNALPNK